MINTDIETFFGLEIGRTDHGVFSAPKVGKKIWNKTLLNDEAKLAAV